MQLRTKIIFILVGLFLIGGIVLLVAAPKEKKTDTESAAVSATGAPATGAPSSPPLVPQPGPVIRSDAVQPSNDTEGAAMAEVKIFARIVVERYGTYSNQNNFANLYDLFPLMTEAFRTKTEALIATLKGQTTGGYAGVTTRALAASVEELTEARARLTVETQRETYPTHGAGTINKRATVHLQKVGDTWKVDEIRWE